MNNDSRNLLVQSNEIIELLKNPIANSFITKHLNDKPESLALKHKNRVNFNLIKLTQLLQLYQKAKYKIPVWVDSRCAMHPKSYEQCSHSEVAKFKSSLFKGEKFLDLTSGLGVDSYYFSKNFTQVTSLEKDSETYAYAVYNLKKLNVDNIDVINVDLENYMIDEFYDIIYLDPDRRINSHQQTKAVESFSPNIFDWYKKLLKSTKTVLIKLSPMVDLNYLEQKIPEITKSYVISYRNDVKEILIQIEKGAPIKDKIRIAIEIDQQGIKRHEGVKKYEYGESLSVASYLFEPSKSIIKAELASSYAKLNNLEFISPKSLYYFRNEKIPNFIGRQFEIIEELPTQWVQLKKKLKRLNIDAINIAQRNFYHDVKTIRAKLRIKEGGTNFLLFTTDDKDNGRCFYCRPVPKEI